MRLIETNESISFKVEIGLAVSTGVVAAVASVWRAVLGRSEFFREVVLVVLNSY
jgi:hypothetical protein